jgi:hypothetical protein
MKYVKMEYRSYEKMALDDSGQTETNFEFLILSFE